MGACKHKFPPPKTAIQEKIVGYLLSVYFLMLLFIPNNQTHPLNAEDNDLKGILKKHKVTSNEFTAHKLVLLLTNNGQQELFLQINLIIK